jgi:hypothetical protein
VAWRCLKVVQYVLLRTEVLMEVKHDLRVMQKKDGVLMMVMNGLSFVRYSN